MICCLGIWGRGFKFVFHWKSKNRHRHWWLMSQDPGNWQIITFHGICDRDRHFVTKWTFCDKIPTSFNDDIVCKNRVITQYPHIKCWQLLDKTVLNFWLSIIPIFAQFPPNRKMGVENQDWLDPPPIFVVFNLYLLTLCSLVFESYIIEFVKLL